MIPNKVTRHRAYEGSRLQTRAILGTEYPIPDLAATLNRQCRDRGDKAEAEAIGFGEAAASLIEAGNNAAWRYRYCFAARRLWKTAPGACCSI
jgi:hypothetical protein